MVAFEFGGRPRRAYQLSTLKAIIAKKGVMALLLDPGMGKTAITLDYMSLLALKSPTGEARVLVVAPKLAVDTWVLQIQEWSSPQVNVWAEVLGGSVMEKCAAMAARGGNPFRRLPDPSGKSSPVKSKKGWEGTAHGANRAVAQWSRPEMDPRQGPVGVPGPKITMLVVNLEAFGVVKRYGSQMQHDYLIRAVQKFAPDLVVVDEMHKIKGWTARSSKVLARATKQVPRRLGLTGTVMPRSPLDVLGQWRYIDPFAFGKQDARGVRTEATQESFKDRYAVLGGFMGKEIVEWDNLDEMNAIMARNAVVLRKEDVLDLPPWQDSIYPVHLTPKEKSAYLSMKSEMEVMLNAEAPTGEATSTATSPLVKLLRLSQITAGHLPNDLGQVQQIGTSKADAVGALVKDTLVGEKRVVVFGVYRHEIDALVEAVSQEGTEVMRVDGNTPQSQRMAFRARFGSSAPERIVMVAQIQTMAESVNELVTASHAVFTTLPRQRDVYVQARGRLDRTGQTRPVTFWHMVAPGTVDEVVLNSHRTNGDLEAAMKEYILRAA